MFLPNASEEDMNCLTSKRSYKLLQVTYILQMACKSVTAAKSSIPINQARGRSQYRTPYHEVAALP